VYFQFRSAIRKLESEKSALQNEMSAIKDFHVKNVSSFVRSVKPRLKASNPRKYAFGQQGVQNLNRDIALLRLALNGKIPNLDVDDCVEFPRLIEKGRAQTNTDGGRVSGQQIEKEVGKVDQFTPPCNVPPIASPSPFQYMQIPWASACSPYGYAMPPHAQGGSSSGSPYGYAMPPHAQGSSSSAVSGISSYYPFQYYSSPSPCDAGASVLEEGETETNQN
jgi:hypothetical protein